MTAPVISRVGFGDFWRSSSNWERTAMAFAIAAVAMNVASYFGLTAADAPAAVIVIHVAVMVLCFRVVFRNTHRLFSRRSRRIVRPRLSTIPRPLLALTAASLIYMITLFVRLNSFGTGGPQVRDGHDVWVRDGEVVRYITAQDAQSFEVAGLRVISAAWLFFALGLTIEGTLTKTPPKHE
jgi:hypothetical protein